MKYTYELFYLENFHKGSLLKKGCQRMNICEGKVAKKRKNEKRIHCSVSFLFYAGNSAPWGESAERTNLQRGENWQPWGIFCQLGLHYSSKVAWR